MEQIAVAASGPPELVQQPRSEQQQVSGTWSINKLSFQFKPLSKPPGFEHMRHELKRELKDVLCVKI